MPDFDHLDCVIGTVRETHLFMLWPYFTQQETSRCSAKSPLAHNVFGLALRLKVQKFIFKLHTFTHFHCSWPTSLETELLSWTSLTLGTLIYFFLLLYLLTQFFIITLREQTSFVIKVESTVEIETFYGCCLIADDPVLM